MNSAQNQVLTQYLEINNLDITHEVLISISIHAFDEEVDPPKWSNEQLTALLRLVQLIEALKR